MNFRSTYPIAVAALLALSTLTAIQPANAQSLSDALGNPAPAHAPAAQHHAYKARPHVYRAYAPRPAVKVWVKPVAKPAAHPVAAVAKAPQPNTPAAKAAAAKAAAAQAAAKHHAAMLAKLAAAQQHHLAMLRLAQQKHMPRVAAATAVAGVGAAAGVDAMTRDGAPSSQSTPATGQSMNLGTTIVQWVGALVVVLVVVFLVIKFLQKRGIGTGSNASYEVLAANMGSRPTTLAEFERQTLAAKGGAPTGALATPIEDIEFLGSERLPGTQHMLYKMRVGDRLLLLGGSPTGTLSTLTEWELELDDEADDMSGSFHKAMNQAGAYGETDTASSTDALRGATRRLGRAVRGVAAPASGEPANR